MAELHDLYTAERLPTGATTARGAGVPEGRWRVIVHVALFGADRRMLIQRRQPFKDGWPGRWDLSAGGSALAGETSRQAAERETMEELGLSVALPDAPPSMTLRFSEGFDDIYAVRCDVDPKSLRLQPEEVAEARWATEDEIHAMIDDGRFIPYRHALISLLFTLPEGGDGGRAAK